MVGETTIALGNPFGLANSVTSGILSAVNREVRFRNRSVYEDFLQTSAMINPGNSGGPLLDINGYVIGINVAIDTRGQGISYAIPINRVKRVMTNLVNPEVVRQAGLGMDVDEAQGGLVVVRLEEKGPAAAAGLHKGDVILSVDGKTVRTVFDYYVALLDHGGLSDIAITYEHEGKRHEVMLDMQPIMVVAQDAGMTCTNLTPALSARYGLPAGTQGVVVLEVQPGGPADRVGIRPGDLILEIGGYVVKDTRTLKQLLSYLSGRAAAIRIVIFRDGEKWVGRMALGG